MSCETSLITSIPIKRCPRNELEWNTRAALLNCSSINQTCVKPDKFEYHCVLNENVNGLVEVCAPSKHVFGNWLQQHMNISIAYFFSNVKEYKKTINKFTYFNTICRAKVFTFPHWRKTYSRKYHQLQLWTYHLS